MARKKKIEQEAPAAEVAEVLEAMEPETETPETPAPRRRMSGDELRAHLRQERREKRLAEKGY